MKFDLDDKYCYHSKMQAMKNFHLLMKRKIFHSLFSILHGKWFKPNRTGRLSSVVKEDSRKHILSRAYK
jgi:hypothetical protein